MQKCNSKHTRFDEFTNEQKALLRAYIEPSQEYLTANNLGFPSNRQINHKTPREIQLEDQNEDLMSQAIAIQSQNYDLRLQNSTLQKQLTIVQKQLNRLEKKIKNFLIKILTKFRSNVDDSI